MPTVRIYGELPKQRAEHAVALLKSSQWSAEVLSATTFTHDPQKSVILVTITVHSSKTGARYKAKNVHQRLAAHGIPFELIAVDPANNDGRIGTNWHVLRKSEHAGRMRGSITRRLRPGSWLDRTFSPLVLGARQVVIAADEGAADLRREELHRQRGEAVNETRVLQRLDSASPTPAPSASPMKPAAVGWWLVLWGPIIAILYFFALNGFDPTWMVALYGAWVLVGTVIRIYRADPGPKAKFDAFAFPLIFSVALAWFMGYAVHNLIVNSPSASIFLISVGLLVAGFGLNVQLRRWELASRLSAHAPIAITIGAFLTPLWGYVTYGVYLEALHVPFDAVQTSTLERAWAGAWTFIFWALAVLLLAALLGLIQWFFGDETTGLGLMAWAAALAILSSSMISSMRDAVESAETRTDGLPRSWYAIEPEFACIRSSTSQIPGTAPSVNDVVIPSYGPELVPLTPHIILGESDQSEWVVLSLDGENYWLIPTSRVQVEPVLDPNTDCA